MDIGVEAVLQLMQTGNLALGYLLLQVGAQYLFTVCAGGQGENTNDPLAGSSWFQSLINSGPDLLVCCAGQQVVPQLRVADSRYSELVGCN